MDNNVNIFDNERLNDIYQKVVNGEITSTAGLNLTLDELFTRDKDGDFLLIDLFKNNVDIDLENEKIRNDGSVFFYFLVYGQDISQFSYDEIDYECAGINYTNVLNYLLEEFNLSINALLIEDKNGTTLLEEMIKKNIDISSINIDDDIMDLEKTIKIITIIIKNNQDIPEDIKNTFEDTLFSTNNDEFFKYLPTKDIELFEKMISIIKEHTEIVDLLCKYHLEYYLKCLNQEIIKKLITKDGNDTYPIDKYVSNSTAIKNISSLINFDENIDFMIHFIKLLLDNKLYNFFYDADENILLYKVYPPKTLLETLIENNINIKINNINNEEIIKILYDNKKLDLIGSSSESIWLSNTRDVFKDTMVKDQTILEYMIDNNYDIKIPCIFEEDTLKILYQKNRPDLLVKASALLLMTRINDNYTYLDYILDCINKGDFEYNIANITAPDKPDMKVDFYLDIAKHDMIGYVKDDLNLNILLKKYDNKTLLEYFLDRDTELTLNKILDESDKMNYSIIIILKARGIKDNNTLNIGEGNYFPHKHSPDTYYGPLDKDSDYLIKELERLFISDGKSDKDLINLLITSYRDALFINYDITIREIEKLIEIKKNHFDKFYYVKDNDNSYFSSNDGCIHMDDSFASTIIHETGHALHYYLNSFKVPDNYDEIVKRARENKELLIKVSDYFEFWNNFKKNLENYFLNITSEALTTKYSKQENIIDIQSILSKDIDKYRDKFKSLKIPEEQLEQILKDTFSVEEYIKREIIIIANEITAKTMEENYENVGAISDIIDAIFEGKPHDGVLNNASGQRVAACGGHGIKYYSQTLMHGFDEMIANFAVLVKSKGSEENLRVLRDIVGDEVYNMISNFYYTNILEMDINKSKNQGGR